MKHVPNVEHDAPKMKGQRARTKDGTLREVRSDKTVGQFEEQYGVKTGRRSDMHLGRLMKERGVDTQAELLRLLRS